MLSREQKGHFCHNERIDPILSMLNDWLGVTTSDGVFVKITEVGEAVDDVVGPMVNRSVVVQTLKKTEGHYTLIDIQAEE